MKKLGLKFIVEHLSIGNCIFLLEVPLAAFLVPSPEASLICHCQLTALTCRIAGLTNQRIPSYFWLLDKMMGF